jgi:hypothetical protein
MLRSRILALACLSALAVTGCSDGTGNTPAPGQSKSASGAGAGSTSSGGVSAPALCDYLRGELPKLQAVGSKVGAEANLAIGLADFFDKAGKPADGAQMDELTTKECPTVRTDVLAAVGKDGFADL